MHAIHTQPPQPLHSTRLRCVLFVASAVLLTAIATSTATSTNFNSNSILASIPSFSDITEHTIILPQHNTHRDINNNSNDNSSSNNSRPHTFDLSPSFCGPPSEQSRKHLAQHHTAIKQCSSSQPTTNSSTTTDTTNTTTASTTTTLATEIDFTLVTQGTFEKLWMLDSICRRWKGPLVVVLVTNSSSLFASSKKQRKLPTPQTFCHNRVYLVYEPAPIHLFPINKIRNIALAHVTTSHFLYVDIDLWPGGGLYSTLTRLKTQSHQTLQRLLDPQHAIVVPSFQFNAAKKVNWQCTRQFARVPACEPLKTFRELDDAYAREFVVRFHAEGPDQASTPYNAYFNLTRFDVMRLEMLRDRSLNDRTGNNDNGQSNTNDNDNNTTTTNNDSDNNITSDNTVDNANTANNTQVDTRATNDNNDDDNNNSSNIDDNNNNNINYESNHEHNDDDDNSNIDNSTFGDDINSDDNNSMNTHIKKNIRKNIEGSAVEHNHVSLIPIRCFYTEFYEPYVVLKKCADLTPAYNERFYGFSMNKVEFVSHLRYAGWKFSAITHGFLFHNPHPKSRAQKSQFINNHRDKMNKEYLDAVRVRNCTFPHKEVAVPVCEGSPNIHQVFAGQKRPKEVLNRANGNLQQQQQQQRN